MSNLLFLPGALSDTTLWRHMTPYVPASWQIHYEVYDHDVLQKSRNLSDLATSIAEKHDTQVYDYLIGHSMGGLLALLLAVDFAVQPKALVLMETNLRPAQAFYRNLLLPQNEADHKEEMLAMFAREMSFYPEELRQTYQNDFDYTQYIRQSSFPVHILYGDRGEPGYANRIEDLNLEDDIIQKVCFHFIPDACHLPMVENPQACIDILKKIIAE